MWFVVVRAGGRIRHVSIFISLVLNVEARVSADPRFASVWRSSPRKCGSTRILDLITRYASPSGNGDCRTELDTYSRKRVNHQSVPPSLRRRPSNDGNRKASPVYTFVGWSHFGWQWCCYGVTAPKVVIYTDGMRIERYQWPRPDGYVTTIESLAVESEKVQYTLVPCCDTGHG